MKTIRLLPMLLAVVVVLTQQGWCGADGGKKKRKRPVILQELSPIYKVEGAWNSNIRRTPPSGNLLSDFIFAPKVGISYSRRNTLSGSQLAAEASYSRHQYASNPEQSHGLSRLGLEATMLPSKRLRLRGGLDFSLNRSIEGSDFNIYTGNTDYDRSALYVEMRKLVTKREWWKARYSFAKDEHSDPVYDLRDSTANTYEVEWWNRFSRDVDASLEYSFTDMNVTQGGYSRDVHLLTARCDRKTSPEAQWRLSAALRRSIFDTFDDGTGPFDRKDTRIILGAQYKRQSLAAGVEYLKNISNDIRPAAVDFGDFTMWNVYLNWRKPL